MADAAAVVPTIKMVDLLPHRAVYKMTLANVAPRAEVASADGVMEYQFGQTCDGWTMENRTAVQLSYLNGTSASTVWIFAGWESADGKSMRFHSTYEQDGRLVERLDGQADLNGPSGSGTVQFSQPPGKTLNLPAGTMFPTDHLKLLIAQAMGQQRVLSKVVFDGADADTPYLVNALFGPLSATDADALAKAAGLKPVSAWWMRLAYFAEDSDGALPEFEIGIRYRADGVADQIVQQYDRYALSLRLSDLEVLPKPDC